MHGRESAQSLLGPSQWVLTQKDFMTVQPAIESLFDKEQPYKDKDEGPKELGRKSGDGGMKGFFPVISMVGCTEVD